MKSFNYKINDGKLGILGGMYFFTLPLIFIKTPFEVQVSDLIGLVIVINLLIKQRFFMNRIMSIGFFLFFIGAIFGMFQSPDIIRNVKGITQQALVIFMLYPVMSYYITNNYRLNSVLRLYKNGALLLAILIILYHFFNLDFGVVDTAFAKSRTIIGDTGPNVVARIFVIGSMISLYFSQTMMKRNTTWKYYVEFLLMVYGVFSTASVSGVILLEIGSLMVLYRYNFKKDYRNQKRVLIISSIGMIVFTYMYNKLAFVQYEVMRFSERFSSTFSINNSVSSSFSSNTRLALLDGFTNNIDKYLIFGIGYNNSNYIFHQTIHFPLVAAIIEIGIVGFLGVLVMYLYPMYRIIIRDKLTRWNITSILSVLIFLGDMIQPNPNYRFTWFAILLPIVSIYNSKNHPNEVK